MTKITEDESNSFIKNIECEGVLSINEARKLVTPHMTYHRAMRILEKLAREGKVIVTEGKHSRLFSLAECNPKTSEIESNQEEVT